MSYLCSWKNRLCRVPLLAAGNSILITPSLSAGLTVRSKTGKEIISPGSLRLSRTMTLCQWLWEAALWLLALSLFFWLLRKKWENRGRKKERQKQKAACSLKK